MTKNEARKILGVDADAGFEAIRIAYKRAAARTHPDRVGGDAEAFDQVAKAFDVLIKPDVCPVCGGKGKIRERNGAFTKEVNCPRCWAK